MSVRKQVTIRGTDGEKQLDAKWDTGADRTAVDYRVAAAVGAGPVVSSVKTHQASGCERRPVTPLWVEVDGETERVEVGLSDREDLSTDMLLGQDVISAVDEDS